MSSTGKIRVGTIPIRENLGEISENKTMGIYAILYKIFKELVKMNQYFHIMTGEKL